MSWLYVGYQATAIGHSIFGKYCSMFITTELINKVPNIIVLVVLAQQIAENQSGYFHGLQQHWPLIGLHRVSTINTGIKHPTSWYDLRQYQPCALWHLTSPHKLCPGLSFCTLHSFAWFTFCIVLLVLSEQFFIFLNTRHLRREWGFHTRPILVSNFHPSDFHQLWGRSHARHWSISSRPKIVAVIFHVHFVESGMNQR